MKLVVQLFILSVLGIGNMVSSEKEDPMVDEGLSLDGVNTKKLDVLPFDPEEKLPLPPVLQKFDILDERKLFSSKFFIYTLKFGVSFCNRNRKVSQYYAQSTIFFMINLINLR